jgi:hypothetical protein
MGAEARAILEPAAANLSEDEPNAAPIFAELSRVYMMLDRSEEAVDRAEQALRAAAPGRDTEVIAQALVSQGSAVANLGRFDEAEALLRGAMLLADRDGHIAAAVRARNNLLATLFSDVPQSALLPLMNESVDMTLRLGLGGWGAQHVLTRAWVSLSTGSWDQARADLSLVADWELSSLHTAWRASGMGYLAAAAGDKPAADAWLAQSREHLRQIDTLPQVASIAAAICTVHVLLGEWSAALGAVEGVEGGGTDMLIRQYSGFAAAATGDPNLVSAEVAGLESLDHLRFANAVRGQIRASAAVTSGAWDEARAAYIAAVAGYRAMDLNAEAALLGLEFAAFLGDRFDEARAAGDAAEAWFAERGAASVVERYRANFAGTAAPPAGAGRQTRSIPIDAEQRA